VTETAAGPAGRPPDLLFCRRCGGSIARRDLLAGRALLLEGRAFCPACAALTVARRETLRAAAVSGAILAAAALGIAAWAGFRASRDAAVLARAAGERAAAAERGAEAAALRLAAVEAEARGLASLGETLGRTVESLKKDMAASREGIDDRLDGVERSLGALVEAVEGLRREVAAGRGPAPPLSPAEEKEFLARLDSVNTGERFEALWRLQRGKGEGARAAAVKGLADPEESVRYQAALLARSLVVAEAVPALVDRLEDPSAAVRAAAADALRRITGKDFGFDPLEPLEGRRAEAVHRWKEWLKTR